MRGSDSALGAVQRGLGHDLGGQPDVLGFQCPHQRVEGIGRQVRLSRGERTET